MKELDNILYRNMGAAHTPGQAPSSQAIVQVDESVTASSGKTSFTLVNALECFSDFFPKQQRNPQAPGSYLL